MNVRIYPEWFIDGPWHGEDKRKKAPHLQGVVRCSLPRPFDVRELLSNELTGDDLTPQELTFDEYTYIPKWVDIFGERICVWVSEENAGSMNSPGRESDWVRMLGQLIMSPHRADSPDGPFNVGGIAQRHRERWDLEHEARREVRNELADLKRRIQVLTRDLQRAQTFNVLHNTPSIHRLEDAPRPSALMEFRDDDGEHGYVYFENIVLFLDEGDGTPENPPAWIATAQGSGVSDSDHKPPCTGYGTTKKAAIIALLADGLGVYARMVEIGERMK